MPKETPVADPSDRTSMDDLHNAVASKMRTGGWWWAERPASEALDAIRSVLRERGLLLGPDGLLRATHVCDGDWDDYGDEVQQSFPFACNWTDGVGEMVAGAPLFTLSPLDPTEDT